MGKQNGIIIFDDVSLMRHRVSSLFQGYDFQVFEAAYEIEIFNILSDDKIDISLVLLDLDNDVNYGFEVIAKIKEKKPALPIIIITANNKRLTFLRSIAEGANDYILKPFEDEDLLNKVLPLLKKSQQVSTQPTQFVFDIRNYLNLELKKAMKGHYEITLLMCTFFDIKNEMNTTLETKYTKLVDSFYNVVKKGLWGTDVFEKYGAQTFIGLFPYCSSIHSERLSSKLELCFQDLLSEKNPTSSLRIAVSTITYPDDKSKSKDLLQTLGQRMQGEIDRIKVLEDIPKKEA